MSARNNGGFTIPEVLVAIVIITVGILAMMGTSAAANKMIARGRRVTIATQVAEALMDSLRLKANENLVACTGLTANGTGYTVQGVLVKWEIGSLFLQGTAGSRDVRVLITYKGNNAAIMDTLSSTFKCDV